jgi:hypothetical protein
MSGTVSRQEQTRVTRGKCAQRGRNDARWHRVDGNCGQPLIDIRRAQHVADWQRCNDVVTWDESGRSEALSPPTYNRELSPTESPWTPNT